MCRRIWIVLFGAVCVASWLTCAIASAAPVNWDANGAIPANGNFNVANNWNPNFVPGAADTAVFNVALAIYSVNFPGGSIINPPINYVIDKPRVSTNEVSFVDLDSPFQTVPSLTIDSTDPVDRGIIIGRQAGDVAVLNTRLNSFSGVLATIGDTAGSNGTLNLIGGTVTLGGETQNDLIIGNFGTGTLNVTPGRSSN